ncbi:hypothetical protein EUGRSUZ_J02128 [Eucalyptus grandis]|uniref:Uncharacterized protein n=2 Tax=Eucalyptus grandis TaxID=71139 RepID=A0ACC3J8L1_EUCGR|nr:hypothetical protein EUGRSUZ_J02128 [Eucalyptus grandis]
MAPRILSLFMLFYCSISYAELITSLPGQPFNVSFKQYSGYVVTDARHGRALFCYFVEAESPIASFLPLTLWLNGGPGCSSLGFGTFMEHGPFKPSDNGSLIRNDYSWNLGHYIPQFAKLLIDYNKRPDIKPIKLRSIVLGNPLLDLDISIQAGDYLWAHGAIWDEMLYLERTVCNNSKYMREYLYDQYSDECNCVLNIRVNTEVGKDVQFDNLLLRDCPLSSSSNSEQRGLGVTGDPCLQGRIFAYLNKPEVQRAIHANTTHLPFNWDFCQGDLKLVTFSKYGPWYDKKQVGGWSQSFGTATEGKNVTYLTFAFTSPSQALTLFRSFLNGSPLPRPRD